MSIALPGQQASTADIPQVRCRIALALDTRDWELLGDQFADTVNADMSSFGIAPGRITRDQVVATFRHAFRNESIRTQQIYSNFLVQDRGNGRATATCYLLGHHLASDVPGGDEFELRAIYQDEYVLSDAGWQVSGFVLKVLSMRGNLALVS
jgi:SnoaL-like domain